MTGAGLLGSHRRQIGWGRGRDWQGFLAYTVSINGFPPKVVEATTVADQWPAEAFTPEGLTLLKGTKQFLVEQKFIRTDFDLDAWIVPQV